jgi:hypothetical protein
VGENLISRRRRERREFARYARSQRRFDCDSKIRGERPKIVEQPHRRRRGALHVEAVELHLPFIGHVPGANPFHNVEHFLVLPNPKPHATNRIGGTALAAQDVVVEGELFAVSGFQTNHREAEMSNAVFDHSVPELKKLPRAVSCFPERDDAGIANGSTQEFNVLEAAAGLRASERERVGPDPIHDRFIDWGIRREHVTSADHCDRSRSAQEQPSTREHVCPLGEWPLHGIFHGMGSQRGSREGFRH